MIAAIVLTSTTGEVLTAAAMKSIGDLDDIRAQSGMKGAIRAVVTCPLFFAGVFFLALAFFALLFALNHLNLSLVAPASASLTLVTNAIAGKFFHYRVRFLCKRETRPLCWGGGIARAYDYFPGGTEVGLFARNLRGESSFVGADGKRGPALV